MRETLFDPRIKLRHLSCMIEVTRQGGVVAASRTLGMSQPAVSKSIAELEKLLGIQLFDRSGRKLQLTREGEIYAQHAIAAAAALREGYDSIDAERSGERVVRLGALPTVEVQVVPRAVAQFMRGPYACTVRIESGPTPHLLNMLRDGHLDFYVGRLASPEFMRGLVFEQLYSDSVVFAVRPSNPLLKKANLSYQDLTQETLLVPPPYAVIKQMVDTLFITGGMGKSLRQIETISNGFARTYTLENDAVWAISRSVVAQDLIDGTLVVLPLATEDIKGPVGITRRADGQLERSSEAMIAAVRDVIGDIESMINKT